MHVGFARPHPSPLTPLDTLRAPHAGEGAIRRRAGLENFPDRQRIDGCAFRLPSKLRRDPDTCHGTPLALIRHRPPPECSLVPAPSPAAVVPTPTKRKRGKKWLWILVASGVLGAGGGWWWWQHEQASAHVTKKAAVAVRAQARYYALEPAFVVNLADEATVRYLQADLQLVTRDPDTLVAFEAHAPAIRNRLLLLFGQQSAAQLAQRSGKERLQQAALGEVRRLLKDEGAPDKVEAVIFTSLVTQ